MKIIQVASSLFKTTRLIVLRGGGARRRGLCWALTLGLAGPLMAANSKYTLLNSKEPITPGLAQAFAEIADSEYNVAWQSRAGAYQAPNREQNLRFTYEANGFSVERRAPNGREDDWQVEFKLQGYGRENPVPDTVPAQYQATHHAVKVTTDGVVFDYTNSPAGMRQTFTINRKPKTGRLSLDVALKLKGLKLEVRNNAACFVNPATEARVFTYNNLQVWDATGRPLAATMRQTGATRMAIEVNDAAARYPVVVDPTVTAFIEGLSAGDQFGFSVAYMGAYVESTFDGGYQWGGVLIGAPWYDAGLAGQGAARIYGRFDGTHSGNWTYANLIEDGFWTGSQANENFGYSVAVAYQYMSPGSFGAVQGDVHDPYIIQFPDVIIGAPNFSTNGLSRCGAAFSYYGRCGSSIVGSAFDGCTNEPFPANPDWATYGTQAGGNYGYCVAAGGSLTGDGYQSMVVGAPYVTTNPGSGNLNGAVYIFPGSLTGLSTTPSVVLTGSTSANDNFGWSLACAGDVDGDGIDDLIVGAPNRQRSGVGATGAALIYTGGPNGLFGATPNTPKYTLWGSQAREQFGYCVCAGFSLFGNNTWDVAVGAPNHQALGRYYCGGVYLFGGPLVPGSITTPTTLLTPPNLQALCRFGASVAATSSSDADRDGDPWAIGDPDDGYSVSLMVGAPLFSSNEAGWQAGAAFLYSNGPTQSPNEIDGPAPQSYFGWSVTGMTPWDNAFLVGAPGYNQYYTSPGSVSEVRP